MPGGKKGGGEIIQKNHSKQNEQKKHNKNETNEKTSPARSAIRF